MKPNAQFFNDTHEDLRSANDIKKQQLLDHLAIALNEEFGFGAERLNRLYAKLTQVELTYSKMVVDDSKDDKKIVYAKDKLDERLRQIFGPDFPEFDKRYGYDKNKMVHIHTKKHHRKRRK